MDTHCTAALLLRDSIAGTAQRTSGRSKDGEEGGTIEEGRERRKGGRRGGGKGQQKR